MKEKTKAAAISVASNTVLTTGKIAIGLASGSVSILSEGIHSGIDLIAAIIALFAVKESGKPADARHAYGHGKIENVSGTVEALLIFMAALLIINEAVHKLSGEVTVANLGWGLAIMGFSAIANLLVSSNLMRVAKKTDSVALEADALHLRTDVVTSAGVFVGLLIMKITGWTIVDPLIAIFVALLIFKAAYDLTKEAFMPLVDVSIDPQEYQIILGVLDQYAGQFVEFHKLRTRRAGSERHIDLHLVVPKYESIFDVHELCNRIELEIKEKLPRTQILIHMEPCEDNSGKCQVCNDSQAVCHKSHQEKILTSKD
ncbi:cation diffusion facilitator family transporter [Desulfitobacterium sp.]|uniref:cation diffusion facilitator family transporter n=1 Tax=Desulfitobacterium sp. TaxID=49981 RepID=UPI002BE28B2B|nr:cation diffusion facilitator family transporter [Desulfitobacterium sp.]HVJ50443.1 cation diffusion facilitator family transporter [Desulfitobacterium sp.]